MNKDTVDRVRLLAKGPKLSAKPPIRWLDLLMAVREDRSLLEAWGVPVDAHRFAAFEAGFHSALALNQLADPDAARFSEWLRAGHLPPGATDWPEALLHACGGDHAAALDRYLSLAARFIKEGRVRLSPLDRRPERVEPGWADPPVPPFFVKTEAGWLSAPSLATLRDAVRKEASKQAPHEAFDVNGRIIRLLARPNLKVRRELSRIVKPQVEAKLTTRRATRAQLHSALCAFITARTVTGTSPDADLPEDVHDATGSSIEVLQARVRELHD